MSFHVVRDVVADFASIRDSASLELSFTASGFLAPVTTTGIVSRLGNQVTLTIGGLAGTISGSSFITLSPNLPVDFIPLSDVQNPIVITISPNNVVGLLNIASLNGNIVIGPISNLPFTNGQLVSTYNITVSYISA